MTVKKIDEIVNDIARAHLFVSLPTSKPEYKFTLEARHIKKALREAIITGAYVLLHKQAEAERDRLNKMVDEMED